MCNVIMTDADVRYWINQLNSKLGFNDGTLTGPARLEEYSIIRYGIYRILKEKLRFTTTRTGALFNRDHSTIVTALKTFENSAGSFNDILIQRYEFIKADFEKFQKNMEVYCE